MDMKMNIVACINNNSGYADHLGKLISFPLIQHFQEHGVHLHGITRCWISIH